MTPEWLVSKKSLSGVYHVRHKCYKGWYMSTRADNPEFCASCNKKIPPMIKMILKLT